MTCVGYTLLGILKLNAVLYIVPGLSLVCLDISLELRYELCPSNSSLCIPACAGDVFHPLFLYRCLMYFSNVVALPKV